MFMLCLLLVLRGDSSLNVDKWGMANGSKEDLILNAMDGFHDFNGL